MIIDLNFNSSLWPLHPSADVEYCSLNSQLAKNFHRSLETDSLQTTKVASVYRGMITTLAGQNYHQTI